MATAAKKKKKERERRKNIKYSINGLLKNNHPRNTKSSLCCMSCGMYISIENQVKLDL